MRFGYWRDETYFDGEFCSQLIRLERSHLVPAGERRYVRGHGARGNVSALEPDVERKLTAIWPSPADQTAARALLLSYGGDGEQEVGRVRLAVLKLSDGSLDELGTMTRAAKADYRDVLMWAEYPEQSKATWTARSNLTAAERRELSAIRARDRKQYRDWYER